MTLINIPFYSWGSGAFIMTIIFGLVIIGLVAAIYLMMSSDKANKKEDQ